MPAFTAMALGGLNFRTDFQLWTLSDQSSNNQIDEPEHDEFKILCIVL